MIYKKIATFFFFVIIGDYYTHLKNNQSIRNQLFFSPISFEIQGIFRVHESFVTYKCDAMYMVFKIKF